MKQKVKPTLIEIINSFLKINLLLYLAHTELMQKIQTIFSLNSISLETQATDWTEREDKKLRTIKIRRKNKPNALLNYSNSNAVPPAMRKKIQW